MLALVPLAIQLVPEIAKWLFGDTAAKTATAVAQVVQQVTGADPSTEAGVAAASAVLQGKPELASRLQVEIAQIAAAREKEQRDADAASLAAQLADVANARQQTVALAQAKSSLQWAPVVVSIVVLATFGTVMFLAITRALPAGSETILNMLLGTLAAMAANVVSYWVGSSAGSAQKTELLYRATPPATSPRVAG
jgi:hypothetical protein